MSIKTIENLDLLMKREGSSDDFYRIFNIPFPNKPHIEDTIQEFIEVLSSYASFIKRIGENDKIKKRYEPLSTYSADVLGYIATSIKLAGESYVGESLAILRSAIDILILSLFTSLTWIPSGTTEEINPLALALESPYYHRLRETSLDSFIVNRIGIGEESEGVFLTNKIKNTSFKCLENYLTELGVDRDKIEPKDQNKYLGKIRETLNAISIEALKNQSENFKGLMTESTSPEAFLEYLMQDERYTFKSCRDHEKDLLEDLKKHLNVKGEITEKITDDLRLLTFQFDIEHNAQGALPLCDYCEKHPVIWSIHTRFDKNSMIKYIKYHLDQESEIKIDNCVQTALGKKKIFFGDLINYELYNELNPYSHGDPKEEPTIAQWYELYMHPFLVCVSCIYTYLIP